MALIDPVILKTRLGDMAGRFDVDALDACDSTSSELSRRAERGAPSGTVLVADRQSAGRGRRGRVWLSEPAASLTFSLLWRFPATTPLSGLSLAVGVALAQAIEALGVAGVCLKWPNDVLLRREAGFGKLGGVLIEMASDRRGFQVIIGIGLNLLRPVGDFPDPVAGLEEGCPAVPERHAVLAALLRELAMVLDAFTVDGYFGQKSQWHRFHAWQGDPVRVLGDEREIEGRCLGTDDDGSLLINTGDDVVRVLSGDVSLRRA